MAKKKERLTAGEVIRRIVLVVAVIVFLVSAGLLAKILWERQSALNEAKSVQKVARPDIKTPGAVIADYIPLTQDALDRLTAINPDFVAWITLPKTNIDYPVVQGKDNAEYLHKTFEGNANSAGTLFLDALNKPDFSDFNSVIYGHHMKNKSMFQNLKLLRQRENFDKMPYVYVQRPNGDILKYEIFSIYVCHADYDYRRSNYGDDAANQAFIDRIEAKSMFKRDAGVKPTDKILTLSTCEYDYADARLVVHAKLVSTTPLDQWSNTSNEASTTGD